MKQPDRDLTSKTLQEMAFLYQDLVEKNLTNSNGASSHNVTVMNIHSDKNLESRSFNAQ